MFLSSRHLALRQEAKGNPEEPAPEVDAPEAKAVGERANARKCGKSTTVDGLPVVGEEALVSAVTEAMYDRVNGHGHHMKLPTGYSVRGPK
eukprot:jgi/Tetstr1/462941/TSEL_007889.t1